MRTVLKNTKVTLNDFIRDGFVIVEDGKIVGVENKKLESGSIPVRADSISARKTVIGKIQWASRR